ncbi:alpha-L-arabinofuranosidase C-terminal domain-containing protein [Carboxylicivirga linearis]|uniref:non-reducing end alpha-L-arabinofuranosidase n=1 Tax=Carboxylicivirga linearis TaxID=1628157 RepID=A0ABS5JY34_9BACT|nr:alpha-L-arabinofuranosidase C-terminal domain-containing protein [Carboxylicivirga linearis]MBS2099384.1 carbohydrate binding domain-containing protein [Carboxylicivirga linearis]
MKKTISSMAAMAISLALSAQIQMTVNAKKPGAEIQPEMYGVFFEDINFGADGGVYAELIKNRSFEFEHPFVGWTPFGDVVVKNDDACFDKNPNYVRVTGKGLRTFSGLENNGFKGIGIKKDAEYHLSFHARVEKGKTIKLKLEIINSHNDPISVKHIEVTGDDWQKHTTVLTANSTDAHSKFRLMVENWGYIDMDHISLFPGDTWKGRENGLRKDLVQALYDLNPGVFRFPGGCIVEGNTLESRYQWKNSVGPVENRPLNINRWNYTFKHKFFPDYYQSYGMGFYEYFLLSEDLGAEPLPVLSCGLACQYESKELVSLEDLEPYIQDALDLIEFANGATTTKWGKVRADMGHPESFNLKFLAIGNEQWGEVYVERLQRFIDVLSKKHPEIVLIGSSGPQPDGKDFDYLWPEMKKLDVALVDEHYYRSPEWFLENAGRYDSYDRKGPKVFAGEYAAHPKNRDNNFEGALAEAAFMTGLERNADMVQMATYAPLFAHVEAWQWCPDMIWFDNLKCVRTPNYYVQQMYGTNAGTHVLSLQAEGFDLKGQDGIYASSVIDKNKSEIIIKVANTNTETKDLSLTIEGLKKGLNSNKAEITMIQSNDLSVVNTLDNPLNIIPQNFTESISGSTLNLKLTKNSFYVIKFSY